ncbi:bacteriophage protein gp37 [Mycobacteroides abscessus subsp. abscessus]|nr:bacteriophage protein gp37 [Mycobacteroides abscessus subsp. abscessus]
MGATTKIEWTDSTWSPVTGCDKVSPGCDNCYPNGFGVTLRPERLGEPLRWRKPRRVFVNSMSDLFHKDVPDEFIAKVFGVMARAPQHTFQILTKRPGRMRSLLGDRVDGAQPLLEAATEEETATAIYDAPWPLPNVWLGVSAEDQKWAEVRIPVLLDTPAAVRFVSAEPLLGPIDLTRRGLLAPDECERRLDWVIVGGESGRGARPMHPEWARSLRDQCTAAGVPFFFKQWGEYITTEQMTEATYMTWDIEHGSAQYHPSVQWRVGKKRAGRELDGRTWDEFPDRVSA